MLGKNDRQNDRQKNPYVPFNQQKTAKNVPNSRFDGNYFSTSFFYSVYLFIMTATETLQIPVESLHKVLRWMKYYQSNKGAIAIKKKEVYRKTNDERVKCDCGRVIRKVSLSAHKK